MEERRNVRQPSGWRYVLIGALTFIFAASLLTAGLILGGGATLIDRVLQGVGLAPSAQPTPMFASADTIVQDIRSISRLETTTYTIERVIEVQQSNSMWPDWLAGDRLLLIANGTIIAGVDLEQLQASDMVLSPDGQSLTVTLPSVEVFNPDSILNNAKTRVYDRQQGILAPPNANLESDARRMAESQLLQAACEEGIMERATEDAAEMVGKMLSLLELNATVRSAPVPPCPED